MKRVLIVLLLALAYVPFIASGAETASAAKGGNGHGKGATNATAAEASVSVPDSVHGATVIAQAYPGGQDVYVFVQCYVSGEYVYAAYFPVAADNTVTVGPLSSTLWMDGAASCTATEGTFLRDGFGRWDEWASTTFQVSG